jgi:beta-lactam-binding protein with PASTA domain
MWKKLIEKLKQSTIFGLAGHVLAMIILGVLVLLIFFFIYLPAVTNHGESITVPELEGMSLGEMVDFLEARNLSYEVSDSGYTSDQPPLTVLKQYPKAGAYVKEGRKIYLTVQATQPQPVKMPNLIDGSLKNAELVLRSYGLTRGEIIYKPDLAQNAVLDQQFEGETIKPGTIIPKGSTIDLIVGDGLGKRVFDAPDFTGLDIEDAEFSIIGSGLNVGSVIVKVATDELLEELDVDSDTAYVSISGKVVRQFPKPGDQIRLGEQVDLWIAAFDKEDSTEIYGNRIKRLRGIEEDTTEAN